MPSAHTSTRTPGHRRRNLDRSNDDDDVSVSSRDTLSESSRTSSSDDGLASKLPTLPDLRFEQSYLATIRGFLHEDQPSDNAPDEKRDHHHKVDVTHSEVKDEHELWLGNLRVEWFPILYVTVRDQLLSPLIQGAAWGLGGLLLTQFRQYLSSTRARSAPRGASGGQRANAGVLRGLGRR